MDNQEILKTDPQPNVHAECNLRFVLSKMYKPAPDFPAISWVIDWWYPFKLDHVPNETLKSDGATSNYMHNKPAIATVFPQKKDGVQFWVGWHSDNEEDFALVVSRPDFKTDLHDLKLEVGQSAEFEYDGFKYRVQRYEDQYHPSRELMYTVYINV